MKRSIHHFLACGALCALSANALLAQQPQQQNLTQPRTKSAAQGNQDQRQLGGAVGQGQAGTPQGQTRPKAQQTTALRPVQTNVSEADRAVAAWLALGNNGEIQLAKLAEEHAESSKTKEFAQLMIKDHSQALDELLLYAPDALVQKNHQDQPQGQRNPATSEGKVRQPAVAESSRTAEQQAAISGRGFNFLEAKRNIGKRCLESANKDMVEKKGREFDMCYIGAMIVKHQEMIDTQKALREYASPELQKVIDEQIQTTEHHLDHAKQLIRQIEKS